MISVILIPLILSILPIEDANIKMQVGIFISEIIAHKYWRYALYLFKRCQKKQIVIPDQTRDLSHNPIFDKVQDYLAIKYAKNIESCELVPKNGDVEFSLSDMTGKHFNDAAEINNAKHEFSFHIQTVSSNPLDEKSIALRQIVVSSKTANPEDIRQYVKRITQSQTKNSNIIRIYRPLIHGKKKDEQVIEWDAVMVKTNKTLKNTVYSEEVEKELFEDIDKFMNNEQWYADIGIPYKRGYFLYSTPGQGKTSVAKIIANKYGTPIFCLDLTIVDDNAVLTKLMTEINYYTCQEKYILLFEDIDRTDFINPRYRDAKLSMDCFLNAIDGVAEPHGRIVFMSANDSKHIVSNTALMRPGRIDKAIEFKACNKSQIKRMYELFYKNHPYQINWDNWEFGESLSAAYVIKLLQENLERPEHFMRLIGTAKTGDDKDILVDDTFKKALASAKSEQALIAENAKRPKKQNKRRTNNIENKVRRTQRAIKNSERRIASNAKALEKAKTKLPLFLIKLKEKQEKDKLRKLKEKAERRKKYIQSIAEESLSEEEYETPAFLANSIPASDVPEGTITTYEVMEDDYVDKKVDKKVDNNMDIDVDNDYSDQSDHSDHSDEVEY